MFSRPPRTDFTATLIVLLGISHNVQSLKTVHTVFTTDCSQYFNWQALGMYHSFQKSKQPGPITRLLSCTEEDLKHFKDVDGIPTHHAPSWSIHPITGDNYSGINKPVAVRDWLNKAQPKEDYILVIDSDTVMRVPFSMEELHLEPGWAVSGFYGYLKGVQNELADKYLPNIAPRNDSLAGPQGRKSDQVGGFAFMRREDLQRMMDGWISITEEVRADPDAWKLSGDVFTKKAGDKPWIAEMYGYSYAAARANIWHHTDNRVMLYPGYSPTSLRDAPNILHYGVNFAIKQDEPKIDFQFDKHWFRDFEPLNCYPWSKRDSENRVQEGLFPNPPHPSKLSSRGIDLLKDLLVIETVATLNEALCLRHTQNCPPSTELESACRKVYELSNAVSKAQKELEEGPAGPCEDGNELCAGWAKIGECEKNPTYMAVSCRASCKLCKKLQEAPGKQAPFNKTAQGDQAVKSSTSNSGEEPTQMQKLSHAPFFGKKNAPAPCRGIERRNDRSLGKSKSQGGVYAGGTDATSMSKPANAQKSKQALIQTCLSDTRLTKSQVRECMEAARRSESYTVPRSLQTRVSQHAQATENVATEEMRKKPPQLEDVQSTRRKLGEMLRHGESEILEGGHNEILVAGAFFGVLVVAFKCCLPRRGHRHKGVRRD